jgi:putative phosphoesterase
MRIGIVSDIHCNATGLRAALEAMGALDELICAGDNILEYRFSNEVIALLRERGAHTIRGNHDDGFLGPHGERARSAAWIRRDELAWLEARPHRLDLAFGGTRIVVVHSTPWTPYGQYVYPHMKEIERFGEVDADVVIYGHTHAPVARRIGSALVINPGSAGQARDGHGLTCAVLDLAAGEARIVEYSPDGNVSTRTPVPLTPFPESTP